jgi:hypothetical protein
MVLTPRTGTITSQTTCNEAELFQAAKRDGGGGGNDAGPENRILGNYLRGAATFR